MPDHMAFIAGTVSVHEGYEGASDSVIFFLTMDTLTFHAMYRADTEGAPLVSWIVAAVDWHQYVLRRSSTNTRTYGLACF